MLIATIEATKEAVTLEEIKKHLKIDHSEDDQQLQSLLRSARQYVEESTGWSLAECEYEWFIENGSVIKSIPLYPAEITSGHDMKAGIVEANTGDIVTFSTTISHYKDALSAAVKLHVEMMYEGSPDDQSKLLPTINNICGRVRRSIGL